MLEIKRVATVACALLMLLISAGCMADGKSGDEGSMSTAVEDTALAGENMATYPDGGYTISYPDSYKQYSAQGVMGISEITDGTCADGTK